MRRSERREREREREREKVSVDPSSKLCFWLNTHHGPDAPGVVLKARQELRVRQPVVVHRGRHGDASRSRRRILSPPSLSALPAMRCSPPLPSSLLGCKRGDRIAVINVSYRKLHEAEPGSREILHRARCWRVVVVSRWRPVGRGCGARGGFLRRRRIRGRARQCQGRAAWTLVRSKSSRNAPTSGGTRVEPTDLCTG